MGNGELIDNTIEIFGFLLAQEFGKSPLTPRDTTRMARSFSATMTVVDGPKGKVIKFTTPYYTEFVNNGTSKIQARKFIQKIIHQKGQELLKKSFSIASKRA